MAGRVTVPIVDTRPLRWLAWAGLAAIVLVRAVVGVMPLDPIAKVAVCDILVYLLPMALVIVGCVVCALRATSTLERRFWRLLAAAALLVLVGEAHFTWYAAAVDFHGPSPDSPIRFVFAVAVFLFIALMVQMSRVGEKPLAKRLRFYLDLSSGVSVAFASVYLLRAPVAVAGGATISWAVQSTAYMVAGGVIVAGTFAVMIGWKAYRWRSWERLVVASLMLFGAALFCVPFWYDAFLEATKPSVGWITAFLGASMYLLFIGTVYRLTASESEALSVRWPVPRLGLDAAARAYTVIIAAFLPVLGWPTLSMDDIALATPALVVLVMLAVLLAASSWLTVLETAHHRLSAVTDEATGAYNQRYLRRRLDELLGGISGYRVSMVAFDVTRRRRLVESYGTSVADGVLRHVADVMLAQAPSGAEVYRLGGGRLAALMSEASTGDAAQFASAVLAHASHAPTPGGSASTGLRAGIAGYPEDASEPEDLVACALRALASAKLGDDAPVAVYDESIELAARMASPCVDLRGLRETVRALAAAVDARDPATKNHSANCAELAGRLARQLGLDDERVQLIGLAAHMHDIGKIGIGDDILLKPGPLTPDERFAVQEHCELGERILLPANLGNILPLVRHHHENWDGSGYPDGLAGEAIPLEARIMAVCDAYETMTAGRPYRAAVTAAEALDEIEKCAGRQFDPLCSCEFVALMRCRLGEKATRTPVSLPELAIGEAGT